MLYSPCSQRTSCLTSHNHQLQYLSNSKLVVTHVVLTLVTLDQTVYKSQSSVTIFIKLKTTSNSCCINLGHTGPDGVQVTIISYNIYQTLKLLVTHAVLTLVTLDKMAYTSHNHQLQYLSNSKTNSDLCWNICKLSFLIDNISE